MNIDHVYTRYGHAVTLHRHGLTSQDTLTPEMLRETLLMEQSFFRVQPNDIQDEVVRYKYAAIEKGETKEGIFLSSHVVCTDLSANKTWSAVTKIIEPSYLTDETIWQMDSVTMSILPTSGEFLTFGDRDTGRGKPKIKIEDIAYGMITTLTPLKPALQVGEKLVNYCILPDLSLERLLDFVAVFEQMRHQRMESNAMERKMEKKGSLKRPTIFRGNFPNAPKSGVMASMALLGAMGEVAKESPFSERAEIVLEALKGSTLYLIKYGEAQPFSYNNYIIDLAKQHKLSKIVDSIYYSRLYKCPRNGMTDNKNNKKEIEAEYDRFDFYTSRFLQQFTLPYFQDFLSLRATYPEATKELFITYFEKMEGISPAVIDSAAEFGRWLNLTAYFAAKKNLEQENDFSAQDEEKAKILTMLESSIYAAKSADALVAQVSIQAGRLSKREIPSGCRFFIEQVLTGGIELSVAKNLLVTFLRLNQKNKNDDVEAVEENYGIDINEDIDITE